MPRFLATWTEEEDEGEILAEDIIVAEDRQAAIASALQFWVIDERTIVGLVSFLCAMGEDEVPLTEDDVEGATDEDRRLLADMVLDLIRDNGLMTDEFLAAVKDTFTIERITAGEAMDVEQ